MSISIWQQTITNAIGDVQPGATVQVWRESDGVLASIFADRESSVPKANPFAADTEGFAFFYAPGVIGGYKITATIGALSKTWRNVALGTNSESDAEIEFPFYGGASGRLTLTSLVPIMTTSVVGAGTVYYTPYSGNIVPLWNGSRAVPTEFSELSQLTTDVSKSPAACAANSNYDVFVWSDGGTLRATRGPAWTSGIARSLSLTLTGGLLLNTSSITNGPAALRGTYVGTIRTNGSSLVDFVYGGLGAGGVASSFHVWNAYNRIEFASLVAASNDTWTYAVADTWRASVNASSTFRHSLVRGLDEDRVVAEYYGFCQSSAPATAAFVGIGLDSTTAFSGVTGTTLAGITESIVAKYAGNPGIGVHFLAGLEAESGGTATFHGDAASAFVQTGLFLSFKA